MCHEKCEMRHLWDTSYWLRDNISRATNMMRARECEQASGDHATLGIKLLGPV